MAFSKDDKRYYLKYKKAEGPAQEQFAKYLRHPQKNVGLGAVGEDIMSGITAVPGAAKQLAQALPGEFLGLGQQAATDVGRANKNVLAGAAQFGESLTSIPRNINDYLAKREIIDPSREGQISNVREYIGKIPLPGPYKNVGDYLPSFAQRDVDFAKALGVEGQQAGDTLARSLAEIPALGIGKGANIASRLASRAGVGSVLGVAHEENPLTAAILNAGIPELPGVALKGAKAVPQLGKAIAKSAGDVRAKYVASKPANVAKSVVQRGEGLQSHYSKQYDSLFAQAESKGVHEVKPPNLESIEGIESLPRDVKLAIKRYEANPSLENAQKVNSDLGKAMRNKKDVTSESREVAKHAQKKVRGAIFQALDKADPELIKKYKEINSGYEREVVPYTTNRAIQRYKAGEISEKQLVEALKKGKFVGNEHVRAKGKIPLVEQHPELKTRAFIDALKGKSVKGWIAHKLGVLP